MKDLFTSNLANMDEISQKQTLFLRMLIIRKCEELLLSLFERGLVRGTIHTCIGQEACAVGVVGALNLAGDIVCSNHRGHGHFLAYSGDVTGLIAEIMGLPQGVCGGIGGSQHLHKNNYYSNGILGGMPPLAVGMAAAENYFSTGNIVCVFIGDGALAEGSVFESMNMAALWKLPILFAIENNKYAQTTFWKDQHAGNLENIPQCFEIPVSVVDGNDVEKVYITARDIVDTIKKGSGPKAIILNTYRLASHSKGDDTRDANEILENWKFEPIARIQQHLDKKYCNLKEIDIKQNLETIIGNLIQESGNA